MRARVTPNTALVGRPSGADIGPIAWNIWKISPWASSRYRLPAGAVSIMDGGRVRAVQRSRAERAPGSRSPQTGTWGAFSHRGTAADLMRAGDGEGRL